MAYLCQLVQLIPAPHSSDRVVRIREDKHACCRGDYPAEALKVHLISLLRLKKLIEYRAAPVIICRSVEGRIDRWLNDYLIVGEVYASVQTLRAGTTPGLNSIHSCLISHPCSVETQFMNALK